MQSIDQDKGYTSLFAGYVLPAPVQRKRPLTERGECLKELSQLTGRSMGFIIGKTAFLKEVADLRYLLSRMKDDVRRGAKKNHLHAFNSALFVPKQ